MRIRNKLLLAMAVPVGLLIVQVAAVNYFVREMQSAVQFIGSAQTVIEADFAAVDLIKDLRQEVKRLPSAYNLSDDSAKDLGPLWQQIGEKVDLIQSSEAAKSSEPAVFESVEAAFGTASQELEQTIALAETENADLDTLLERAIFTDKALVGLVDALGKLAVELRGQLQLAVDRERDIHNRPVIAGIAIGALAFLVMAALAWFFVDRSIVGRLTALSSSMLAIAGGNLRASLPSNKGNDEIAEMAKALTVFRDTAVEVEENNLREIAEARQRLIDAIESISEGFALFDAEDRLVLCNTRYRDLLHPDQPDFIQPGVSFEDIIRQAMELGHIRPDGGDVEQAIEQRLLRHRDPSEPFTQRRAGGRWVRISERGTEDKGTVAVYSDITELKRRETELADARDEAMEATQAKSQFLANMSHELRTPLNAIIGYSEMLHEEADDLGQEDFLPDLEKIQEAGKHLLGLINDILDLSKIEAGKMSILVEEFDVNDLINQVASVVQPLMAKNGNRLEVKADADLGSMRSDQTKLRQNLFNLLSNAAKFTKDGTISLSVAPFERDSRTWLTFSVKDTGIGMSEEQLGKLFRAFSQAEASTSRDYGGTGLGLAITRHFCHMLGGNIEVASAPGEGSVFKISLPASFEEVEDKLQPEKGVGGSGTVLIIDDEQAIHEMLGEEFAVEGYQVLHASGGREGLRLAKDLCPDVIALDIIMPDIDGWSVLKELKSDTDLRHIPVVMMTILGDREMGYALGASDYITKPFDRDAIVEAVKRVHRSNGASDILVVDDDPKSRDLLRRSLVRSGYRVAEAENGLEAIAALEQISPAVILLDLMMPGMDGFEVLERLRHVPAWQDIPVIIVTAKDLTPDDLEWLNGHILKVFQKGAYDRRELIGTVSRMMQQRSDIAADDGDSRQT
ncbi:MAG: response regulator [Geminicoccaceae bacterium]